MPSIQNITNIPAPRVEFIDSRTGLMSREWYRFFLNLFTLTGSGNNPTSLEDLQLGPTFEFTPDMFVVDNLSPDTESAIATLSMSVNDFGQSLQTLPVDFGGTVSSVNVTLATTGTDVSFSAANSTTAPVIALSIPTASAVNRGALSAADWTTFNNKGSGTVTSVTGTAPVVSSGGNTPAISMAAATTSVDGYLTATDFTTFNNKGNGTVTSVAALTLGTSGTDVSSSVATSTTTPVITLNIPTASAVNRGALSAADWTTFNAKGSGTVTSVTGTAPVVSSGGAAPAISMAAASTTVDGYLTAANFTIFNNKGSGSVTSVAQTFTGGLISVGGSPITTSGTLALTVAGTSGGVVYFTSASTWASSALLAANALVVGGGAGLAPATVTTGANVVTALGVAVGTAGSFVVNGGVLGTPSSGTVTNLTGTASININGTVGATTASTGAFTSLSYTTTLTGGTGIVNLGSGQFYKGASGNVGIGTTTGTYQLQVTGTGQETAALTDAGNKGGSIYLQATAVAAGTGGAVLFGSTFGSQTPFAAIKGFVENGGTNTTGSLRFSTRNAVADTALTERAKFTIGGDFLLTSTGGLGYGTGSGGAVTQITSRTTGVTLNKTNGAVTMFSAAGSAVAATFTVTNSTVAATDTVLLSVKSSTNVYLTFVTAVAAGSFNVTFQTTGGVSVDAPVINFAVIKAVTA